MLRKILIGIVALSLLISIPSFIQRIQVEKENNTYELTIPYDQLNEMIELGEEILFTEEEFFAELKNSGLRSIGLEPITIEVLEDKYVVKQVTVDEMIRYYRIPKEKLPEANGIYLEIIEPDHPYVEQLLNAFAYEYAWMKSEVELEGYQVDVKNFIEEIEVDNRLIYFFPNTNKKTKLKPLGFDMELAEKIVDTGLNIIPRISNDMTFIERPNHYIYEQLEQLADLGAKHILFLGTEVVGYGKPAEGIKQFASTVKELGYDIATIEFTNQTGMGQLLSVGDLKTDVVRLLSLTIGKGQEKNVSGEVNKAVRAIKERNIRILYINALKENESYENIAEVVDGLEGIHLLVQSINKKAPVGYEIGLAKPFADFSHSKWSSLIALIGAGAFIILFVQIVLPKFTLLATIGTIGVIGLQFVTGHMLLLKAIALLVGVLAATLAVISVKNIENWRQLFWQYFKTIGIALIGAAFIVLLLYGTVFVVKTDQFSGVKVLAIFPMIFGTIVIFYKDIWRLLHSSIKYWHLLVFLVMSGVLIYYVLRTGNDAATLDAELRFRQMLEDILYVRPRTTEFLIGLPLFFLGIYMTMLKKKYGRYFVAVGLLATASIVGTFTHLHTPLYISGLRTLYSVLLGMVIGFVLIIGYRIWINQLYPYIQKRWNK